MFFYYFVFKLLTYPLSRIGCHNRGKLSCTFGPYLGVSSVVSPKADRISASNSVEASTTSVFSFSVGGMSSGSPSSVSSGGPELGPGSGCSSLSKGREFKNRY